MTPTDADADAREDLPDWMAPMLKDWLMGWRKRYLAPVGRGRECAHSHVRVRFTGKAFPEVKCADCLKSQSVIGIENPPTDSATRPKAEERKVEALEREIQQWKDKWAATVKDMTENMVFKDQKISALSGTVLAQRLTAICPICLASPDDATRPVAEGEKSLFCLKCHDGVLDFDSDARIGFCEKHTPQEKPHPTDYKARGFEKPPTYRPPAAKDGWCEHWADCVLEWSSYKDFNFCPICATPRPAPPSEAMGEKPLNMHDCVACGKENQGLDDHHLCIPPAEATGDGVEKELALHFRQGNWSKAAEIIVRAAKEAGK